MNHALIAQIRNPALGPTLDNLQRQENSGVAFLNLYLPKFVQLGLLVGALLFFAMLLFGAIQWISSGGDKAALETARGRITNAIIGLVVLFSVFAFIVLIENFFDISILQIDLSPFRIN